MTSHDRLGDGAVRDGSHGDGGARWRVRDLQWLVWRLGRLAAMEAGRHPQHPLKVGGRGGLVGAVVRYQGGTLWRALWRANEVLLHSVCAGAPCIVIL